VGKTIVIRVKFLAMLHVEHYYHRPLFHGAIQKIKVARFYGPPCITTGSLCKTAKVMLSRLWRFTID